MHKRSRIAIIIGLSLSLSLSACVVKSQGGKTSTPPPAADPSGPPPPADPSGPPPPTAAAPTAPQSHGQAREAKADQAAERADQQASR
jgi:hypothetical protein